MGGHYIELANDGGEPVVRFVCENGRGDPCHRKHPDPDADRWDLDDPDLIDGDECWAMTWWDAVGVEALRFESTDGPLARVAVEITYDEGIVARLAPAGGPTSAQLRPAGATKPTERTVK